jgi:hypothetical protein
MQVRKMRPGSPDSTKGDTDAVAYGEQIALPDTSAIQMALKEAAAQAHRARPCSDAHCWCPPCMTNDCGNCLVDHSTAANRDALYKQYRRV